VHTELSFGCLVYSLCNKINYGIDLAIESFATGATNENYLIISISRLFDKRPQ
jgi:hypothetical protein